VVPSLQESSLTHKFAAYALTAMLALTTMTLLAPTGSAEHCFTVGAYAGPAHAGYNNCDGTYAHVVEDPDEDDEVGTTTGYYHDNDIMDAPGNPYEHVPDTSNAASGPCWYVNVPEQAAGPASASVTMCDPDAELFEHEIHQD
jgi:hypothetical protein